MLRQVTLRIYGAMCFAALAGPLAAQSTRAAALNPRLDVAVGITMDDPKDVNRHPRCDDLGLPCETTGKTFPDFGIVLQGAMHASTYVSIVGEASLYFNLWDTVGVSPASSRQNHVSALLAGPRLITGVRHISAGSDDEAYRAFVQILAGGEASTILPTRFALQPGAGLDVQLSRPDLWFRVGYDYRKTRGEPRNLSQNRVTGALVLTR